MKKKKKALGAAVAFVLAAVITFGAFSAYSFVQKEIGGSRGEKKQATVEITQYDYAYDVAIKLKDSGIIKNDTVWNYWMDKHYPDFAFTYGEFNFNSQMSYEQIAKKLETPDISHALVKVTVPEGFTVFEIAQRLEESKVCPADDFLAVCRDGSETLTKSYSFISDFPQNEYRAYLLEGFLFPATYDFAENTPGEDVASAMLKAFDDRYTDEIRSGCEKLNMSLYELITLASVVQEEALAADSARNIASVFINRLEINQMLQSDVTIFYANKLKEKGYSQAVLDAYNCYKCPALPAGPVCNPGLEMINAVIDYPETDYYYFFSDLKNEFHFAKTYPEFESLKQKYPWQ